MRLYLVPSKSVEEEIEEIQLPLFDIIVNEDGTWFEKEVSKLENDTNE
jgi:hypothetical protein